QLSVTFMASELAQEPEIVLVEQPDVRDAIPDHGDAFDPESKRPSRPDLWIPTDVFQHLRMHHAASSEFEPFLAHFFDQRAAEIDLETGFRITEVMRTKAHAHIRPHQLLED